MPDGSAPLVPDAVVPAKLGGDLTNEQIVQILVSYRNEAEEARKSGPNGRDETWRYNWDLYWGRYDFSKKADWQSKIVMPEAPAFVDRWAAAMREALIQDAKFFDIEDPADLDGDMVGHIERLILFALGRCGRTPQGQRQSFDAVFEDVMKSGALMTASLAVTWAADRVAPRGYVAIAPVDSRQLWLDHTGRGLYRVRREEIDRHELLQLAQETDSEGNSLFDVDQIMAAVAHHDEEMKLERERSSGHGQDTPARKVLVKDEYLATIVDQDGNLVGEGLFAVVINDRFLIRGPEENPFWHGSDWIVTTPLVTVPFSVYGRSYVEDWSSVASAFIEMTNLILDATFAQSMRAFALQPDLLEDPKQAESGVHPGKTFVLAADVPARDFLSSIELGDMGPEPVSVWRALKEELREGAKLNEIALGQLPPKGEITATEVTTTQQSSSAVIRSIARTVETRLLEQTLSLVWQTAIQHMDFTDPELVREIGEDACRMFDERREEFRDRHLHFRVRGISGLIDRQVKLRNFLNLLQIVGSNEILLREFLDRFSGAKVLSQIITLLGIDPKPLEPTARERLMQQVQQAAAQEVAAALQGVSGSQDRTGGEMDRLDGVTEQ